MTSELQREIFFEEELTDRQEIRTSSKYLYHYTSYNTLVNKILETKTLSFTNAEDFKDKLEGKVIQQLFKDVCDNLLLENKIAKEFYDKIYDIEPYGLIMHSTSGVDSNGVNYIKFSRVEYETYVICFTFSEDDINMWNEYDNNDGINFSIRFTQFTDLLKDIPRKANCSVTNQYFFEVIYKKEEQIKRIENEILHWNDLLVKNGKNEEDINSIKNHLKMFLHRMQFMFKEESFEFEKECRIILYRKKDIEDDKQKISINGKRRVIVNLDYLPECFETFTISPNSSRSIEEVKQDIEKYKNNTVSVQYSKNK